MHERSGVDALLPREMAEKAEAVGVAKAALAADAMFVLGVLAGAFIALGAIFSTVATTGAAGALPFGVTRVLAGVTFSVGLVLVLVGGAELFTGNTLMVMAWASGKLAAARVLRSWAIVYAGNAVGAVGTAVLVVLAGHHESGQGQVGRAMLAIAEAKLALGFGQAVVLGVLCNALVCLAVWLSLSARSTSDRLLAVVPPVALFVAAGFEHSIANLYFVPVALLLRAHADAAFWSALGDAPEQHAALTLGNFLARNLVPVTLGNVIGGAVLVGLVYWFVYLRGRARG